MRGSEILCATRVSRNAQLLIKFHTDENNMAARRNTTTYTVHLTWKNTATITYNVSPTLYTLISLFFFRFYLKKISSFSPCY
jgi:hypothetical protein